MMNVRVFVYPCVRLFDILPHVLFVATLFLALSILKFSQVQILYFILLAFRWKFKYVNKFNLTMYTIILIQISFTKFCLKTRLSPQPWKQRAQSSQRQTPGPYVWQLIFLDTERRRFHGGATSRYARVCALDRVGHFVLFHYWRD